MYTFLFTILVLDAIVLVIAILLQSGKGSGLAASFGGASSAAETVIGTRQAGNLLTRTSWWAGGIFLGLSFILQLAGARQRSPRSVLDQTFGGAPAPAAAGRAPGQGGTPSTAPAVPLTPAAPPAGAPAGGAPAGSAPAGGAPAAGNAPATGGAPAPR
jgi:preprotein translocase subunit SecG